MILFLFLLLILIGLVIAATSNKVVVFYDMEDVGWTVSPFVFMIGGMFVSAHLSVGEGFFDNVGSSVAYLSGAAAAIYGGYRMFLISIEHNGLVLGLVIGFFKMLVAMIVTFMSVSLLSKAFTKNPSVDLRARIVALIVFGVMLWIVSKLINGERVYAARGLTYNP